MGTLIRSAIITHEAKVLPLREAPKQAIAPAIMPVIEQTPIASTTSPIPPELVAEPINIDPTPGLPIYEEKETPLPDLDPELKQALLEEIQTARATAVQEGFEAGHTQGMTEANQSLQTQIESVNKLLNTVSDVLQSQINGLEDILVTLAFETVCKIIGNTLITQEGVVAVVREVIGHVKESEPITIRICPADYNQLINDPTALTQTYSASGITLVADDRVILGGCLIETSGGSLDGRLETQLQQVKDALLSARRQRTDRQETSHAV